MRSGQGDATRDSDCAQVSCPPGGQDHAQVPDAIPGEYPSRPDKNPAQLADVLLQPMIPLVLPTVVAQRPVAAEPGAQLVQNHAEP